MKKSIFCSALFIVGATFAGETEITTDNVVGVMPVSANGRPQVILSVPWVAEGGGFDTIAVSNLVKTASLTAGPEGDPADGEYAGDMLYWYDNDTEVKNFKFWRLATTSSGVKYWRAVEDGDGAQAGAPDVPQLSRGQAVILQRASSNEVIYVVGQVGTNATVTTTIAPSSDGSTPTYTLVAPPTASSSAVNVNDFTFHGEINSADRITSDVVGNLVVTIKRKNDKWVLASNGKEAQAMIQAGRGFFYERHGTGSLSITWDAPSMIAPAVSTPEDPE